MENPFSLWTVFVMTIGIGGLTLMTWLSFTTEKIDETTGRVVKPGEETEESGNS